MNEILTPGLLLVSDPFLKDANFLRTAVLLCEHQFEGSLGFVLNKPYQYTLGKLISGLDGSDFPVYYGGPVQTDTIHFLHNKPDLIHNGIQIKSGIYWGGEFDEVVALMKKNKLTEKDIRFFIGYSGWGEGQLQRELKDKSWIPAECNAGMVFNKKAEQIWKDALTNLGGEYELMPDYPIDPQLN